MHVQNISNTYNVGKSITDANCKEKETINKFVNIITDTLITPVLEKNIYPHEQANPFHKYLIQEYAKLFVEMLNLESFISKEMQNTYETRNKLSSINTNTIMDNKNKYVGKYENNS